MATADAPDAGFGWLMLAFGAVIMAVTLMSLRLANRRGGLGSVPPSATFVPPSEPHVIFRGGARVNGINASWPMGTLALSDTLAVLSMPLADTVDISRAEVTQVRWRRGMFGISIRFDTPTGRLDAVRFSTARRGELLSALRDLDWPL